MSRAFFTAALTLTLAAPLWADEDVDPEPPSIRSTARSGEYFVRADKDGNVLARMKQQTLWQGTLQDGSGPSQVAIVGGRVVFVRGSFQTVLDLNRGNTLWVRKGSLTKAKLSVKDDRLTLTEGNRREVLDVSTGQLLESE